MDPRDELLGPEDRAIEDAEWISETDTQESESSYDSSFIDDEEELSSEDEDWEVAPIILNLYVNGSTASQFRPVTRRGG